MREQIKFASRKDFRDWLQLNHDTSSGIWLLFSKKGSPETTIEYPQAVEEALCFGWIDGHLKSIDQNFYQRYFCQRKSKSNWSNKNKETIVLLREQNLMTLAGELAISNAQKNGMWNQSVIVVDDQMINDFIQCLAINKLAQENFIKMASSYQKTYVKRYHSFKSDEGRQKDLLKIIQRLVDNLKPDL